MAGKLIVLEGMDGAGTTTQAAMLLSYLTSVGHKAILSAEPTKSPIGLLIRKLLSTQIEGEVNMLAALALCFAADRMQHVHEVIGPGLKNHEFVILDRYVLSSFVYQGLHLPTNFIKEINKFAIKPDLVIVLDLDAKTALERLKRRATSEDFYETPQLLSKIRSRYLHFAKDEEVRTVLIDGNGSPEQVHSHIRYVMEQNLGNGDEKK